MIGSAGRLEATIVRVDGKVVATFDGGDDSAGAGARCASAQPGPLGDLAAVATHDNRLLFLSASAVGLAFEINLPLSTLSDPEPKSVQAGQGAETPRCIVEVTDDEAEAEAEASAGIGTGTGTPGPEPGPGPGHGASGEPRRSGAVAVRTTSLIPDGDGEDDDEDDDEDEDLDATPSCVMRRSLKTPTAVRTGGKAAWRAAGPGPGSDELEAGTSDGSGSGPIRSGHRLDFGADGLSGSKAEGSAGAVARGGAAQDPLDFEVPHGSGATQAGLDTSGACTAVEPPLVQFVPLPQPVYPIGASVAAQSVPQKNGANLLRWSPDGRYLAVRNSRTPRIVFVVDP